VIAPSTRERVLVLACGALAREVLALVRANAWEHVDIRCLPASLHAEPRQIAPAVDSVLEEVAGGYDRVLVAYADCGTSGALDAVLARYGAERLPGPHCYALFAGRRAWDALQDDEPGTFYLTDFLARHFESLVIRPLGLDRYPQLSGDVFRHYRRVVYLAQTDDDDLLLRARAAAARLGLEFERRWTGYGGVGSSLVQFAGSGARG
jgi:hypothetical protein